MLLYAFVVLMVGAFAQPEDGNYEQDLLKYVLENANYGDPESVLNTIDRFCSSGHWMMNVGDVKGKLVEERIQKYQPQVIVELGAYCGYSAVRFANLQRQVVENAKYFSFEFSQEFADIAMQIVSFAGLSDHVTIKVGAFDKTFPDCKLGPVDMFFIDHAKDRYLPDVKLIIENGALKKGSIIVADNIICPGAPEYKEFMMHHLQFKSELIDTFLEYSTDEKDAVMISEYIG